MAKNKIGAVRGMHDILPNEMAKLRFVSEKAREVFRLYGFREIATPIVEYSEVFKRSLGASSDVVNKEMYVFPDRKGEELVLRPENTASIVRAFIGSGLHKNPPARFFYDGPMFRYERPQLGRQRQFNQIGIELIGNKYPFADVEVIACGWHVLDKLGLANQVSLQLNSLGDSESRAAYRVALSDYLQTHKADLSEDSQRRLDENPLRVLDSKSPQDKRFVANAPKLAEYLNAYSHDFFASIQDMLRSLDIDFEINEHLVRGLDYYCHTVFEFTTRVLGAQGTILAGGRYDGLVAALGGNDISGIGWASGVERLALMLDDRSEESFNVAIGSIGKVAEKTTLILAHILRQKGISVYHRHAGNITKNEDLIPMHTPDGTLSVTLIIGDDELASKTAILQDLRTAERTVLESPYDMPDFLTRSVEKKHLSILQKALKEFYGRVGR